VYRKPEHLHRATTLIRIQWRLCFVWTANGPERVEIVDYH